MLMAVNEPYALMVQPDDILISPREVDEHFGTMVWAAMKLPEKLQKKL